MAKKFRLNILPILLMVGLSLTLVSTSILPWLSARMDSSPPVIEVWYGSRQAFGQAGVSQRWVNVLGNAADPQSKIARLDYRLNGGPAVGLSLGPDERRLSQAGDFNVEIDPLALRPGDNEVRIDATNGAGVKTSRTVTIAYHPSAVALPFHIDWAKVKNAQDVLQIVDGKWRWDSNGIRPVELGYDRFLTVGSASWTDYQVTVPVTVHGFDESSFMQATGGKHAGISIDLRWQGHSDVPRVCDQPHCGWDPVGNFNKYFYMPNGVTFLGIKVKEKEEGFPTHPYKFQIGHTYIYKVSVQTVLHGNQYRMKVWEKGTPEPAAWVLENLAEPGSGPDWNPDHGAFSLVAHHSDVTFGNIDVVALPAGK